MNAPLNILMLEDVATDARLVELELRRSGVDFRSQRVQDREEFLRALNNARPDLVLADYSLPAFDGLAALKLVRQYDADLPFIFVSGAIGEELAIEALKSGATDYVLKDRLSRLPQAVHRALAEVEERVRRRAAEEALWRAHADLERRVQERTAALAEANAALQRSEARLEVRVVARTAELSETAERLQEANRALAESRGELQRLSHLLVEVQESERHTIARELHDEAGQALTSIMVGLHLLEDEAACSTEMKDRIGELKRTTESVMEGLHRLAVNLRPASLDKVGLVPALTQYVEQFERQYGIEVVSHLDGLAGVRLPADAETALYRIVQEALVNVARHAHATNIGLILTRNGSTVTAIVEDDGVGCDPIRAMHEGRLGLLGMRERAEMLGGTLTIESAPSHGTTVFVEVPCR